MATSSTDDDLVVWATPEHERCSRHRNYALTCDQFDALLERAGGHCELCGADREDSAWGCLHIDHEHQVGRWAVRGLLCDACNLKLQRGRRLPRTPRLERYLANAWYATEIDRLGLSPDLPDEPALGSIIVVAKGGNWTRLSATIEASWGSSHRNSSTLMSWRQLWYAHGPINTKIHHSDGVLRSYVERTHPQYALVKLIEKRQSPSDGA